MWIRAQTPPRPEGDDGYRCDSGEDANVRLSGSLAGGAEREGLWIAVIDSWVRGGTVMMCRAGGTIRSTLDPRWAHEG